jgi:C4-dicarboxylate-specific signal transduction histidine kinase
MGSWLKCCADSANDPDRLAHFLRANLASPECGDPRLQTLQLEMANASRVSALGEMAAMLAHELNQPLAAIANYVVASERLLSSASPDRAKIQADLARVAEEALRAGEIIRNLRAFVAKDASEQHCEDLAQVLEDAGGLTAMDAPPVYLS